ncbi:MAG: hypothetical protein A2X56_11225 [Nitrospirae bacterium GWC2_57_13]|jgi:Zn-dependent protease with chaperone function|nr:MAG: hypothetical protein A2072_07175 [Nitrospirae bacterium GWC1_57_7]OGW27478.1 MAG: hypothetical protein A2X56_11225 [Nitrospirae bacterium GWC2_57_13]HAR46029.1 hypothetical protein [Nitrospiraceae bacterium]
MITFRATYFDGLSSTAHPVTISADEQRLRIQGDNPALLRDESLRDCVISPPLGKTKRTITLSDGAMLETDNLAAVESLEQQVRGNRGMRFVHFLESRWKTVAVSFLGLALCVWIFMVFGIPALAKKIAYAVPQELSEELSRKTMDVLDKRLLRPSKLPKARIRSLEKSFRRLHRGIDPAQTYRILFRKSPIIGPNAFALPSGTIVMTDELVRLAKHDREIEGVMVHEIAHVEQRHGLRNIIQDAGVFLVISALVGDVTSITSVAATLPTVLAEARYSRAFEREADERVASYFTKKGWSTKYYQRILRRITRDMKNYPGESLLSSHPLTEERIRNMQDYEKAARKKR